MHCRPGHTKPVAVATASPSAASVDAHRAAAIEPLGERARELVGHVLRDEERGRRSSAGSSRRSRAARSARPSSSRSRPPASARRTRRRCAFVASNACGLPSSVARAARVLPPSRRGRRERRVASDRTSSTFCRISLAQLRRVRADLPIGLRDEVEGTELERFEHVLLLRVARAHDDDGRRLLRHQDAQEGEPIHARHLEVERDDVGLAAASRGAAPPRRRRPCRRPRPRCCPRRRRRCSDGCTRSRRRRGGGWAGSLGGHGVYVSETAACRTRDPCWGRVGPPSGFL